MSYGVSLRRDHSLSVTNNDIKSLPYITEIKTHRKAILTATLCYETEAHYMSRFTTYCCDISVTGLDSSTVLLPCFLKDFQLRSSNKYNSYKKV